MKLLEDAGIIGRYVALVDADNLGMGFVVFARIWLTGQDQETVEAFVAAVQKLPQIVECQLMAASATSSCVSWHRTSKYRKFQIGHLGRIKGVRNIKTEIPM